MMVPILKKPVVWALFFGALSALALSFAVAWDWVGYGGYRNSGPEPKFDYMTAAGSPTTDPHQEAWAPPVKNIPVRVPREPEVEVQSKPVPGRPSTRPKSRPAEVAPIDAPARVADRPAASQPVAAPAPAPASAPTFEPLPEPESPAPNELADEDRAEFDKARMERLKRERKRRIGIG